LNPKNELEFYRNLRRGWKSVRIARKTLHYKDEMILSAELSVGLMEFVLMVEEGRFIK